MKRKRTMTRLMRYMLNYRGKKLVVAYCKLSKRKLYNLPPPELEIVETNNSWQCKIAILNGYAKGTTYRYTTDGTYPTVKSPIFDENTLIDTNCTVRIIAVYETENIMYLSASFGEVKITDLKNEIPEYDISFL